MEGVGIDLCRSRYRGGMWWSDDEWARLAAEETCGMCADAHLPTNEHSVLIARTDASYVRLARNQAHPGYSLVILREHVTGIEELSPSQLKTFWADVQRAGRAVQQTFTPKKIDYLVMGHRMPHLHCHLLPQHAADDPRRNPDISDGPILARSDELEHSVRALQRSWERL